MSLTWSIATPAGRAGAIAVVALGSDTPGSLDRALDALGCGRVPVGSVRAASIGGVDRGVVARWTDRRADLMPHGGVAVLRALSEVLRPLSEARPCDPPAMYPEADGEIEAHALAAMARAASPRAVGLLGAQAGRWGPVRTIDEAERRGGDTPHTAALAHLIDPPLVVAIGPPNVGKSSLLNALAGRRAALEADQAGTTRDHVGAMLELDGLTVRYVDTPGRAASPPDPGGPDGAADALARRVAAGADLVLSCADAGHGFLEAPRGVRALRVALRADLGAGPGGADARTSARTGEGLGGLATLVRRALVPDEALADARPWRFWSSGGADRVDREAPG